MKPSPKMKPNNKFIAALSLLLLVCWSALFLTSDRGTVDYADGNDVYHLKWARQAVSYSDDFFGDSESSLSSRVVDPIQRGKEGGMGLGFAVCGRRTGSVRNNNLTLSPGIEEALAECPPFDPRKKTLILKGAKAKAFGQTGNHMRSLLNAIQYARDNGYQLGILYKSWAMELITSMWMVRGPKWESQLEKALCIRIFRSWHESRGWNKMEVTRDTYRLSRLFFYYRSLVPDEQTSAREQYTLRTLFRHYNTGYGRDQYGNRANDMCTGIDSIFGKEDRSYAVYSAIHLRYLEGKPGREILGRMSQSTGCDPVAALEMWPDYVKSILAPLGMLEHPIVIITDGQNRQALKRLKADPEIGPMIRIPTSENFRYGGDSFAAIMANVFVGNPASTMSTFIAKTRVALGFGQNYIYRAKRSGGDGEWFTVCGDECLFRKPKEVYRMEGWTLSKPFKASYSESHSFLHSHSVH